jgi:P-type E1-E2 ATPase
VVNTGHDTKIMMSNTKTQPKTSNLESKASFEIVRIVGLLATICLAGAIGATVWNSVNSMSSIWYMHWSYKPEAYFFIQYFYYFLLHATFIPVALYVSMAMVRSLQSYFMNNDLEMYYAATDTPALVRTMTLNEELGQISHVFSDKTGTLTCNLMDFRKVCE